MSDHLLSIEELRITYRTDHGPVHAVDGLTFDMDRERLGLVGESGSGKSSLARAIIGLLPRTAQISAARLAFDGMDATARSRRQMRRLRGRHIGLIPQHPLQALNPMLTIGRHVREVCRQHLRSGGATAQRLGLEALDAARLSDPHRVWRAYPHELSGGMAQRVMIALALLPEPDLLIADEPTSALDAVTRHEIVDLLLELAGTRGMAVLMISHDLTMVSRLCDRILVMQDGQIVDRTQSATMEETTHPYTRTLLDARPRLERLGIDPQPEPVM